MSLRRGGLALLGLCSGHLGVLPDACVFCGQPIRQRFAYRYCCQAHYARQEYALKKLRDTSPPEVLLPRPMRVVTVCEEGLNRSVVARWMLQHQGHEVIPVGLRRTSPDTLAMLFDWADVVLLLDARLRGQLSVENLIVWDVGPDLFPHHYNAELVRRLRAFGQLQQSAALDRCPGSAAIPGARA
jgi:hypothetical protein